ncbi:MAG: hypothetical protein ACNA7V_03175 [Bacteroidales bacterium]
MKKLIFVIFGLSISLLSAQNVNVTFRVDMQNETVPIEGVHVAGSFQGWDPGSTPLVPMFNNVWEITLPIAANTTIEYKFVNGNSWGQDESVFGPCGAGNGNRTYDVPSTDVILPLVCFGSCLACVLPKVDITFQVDMTNETVSPSGVFLQGSFQDPQWSGVQMNNVGNDIYAVTVEMDAGTFHEYKFLNGSIYETVPPACGFGGFSNRYLTVPDVNTTLDLVCFSSCDPCVSVTDINVTFRVDMSQQVVNPVGVYITGGFQGWDPGNTPMTDMGNGIWQYTTILQSGSYHEYKFINGNTWNDAEGNIPWYCNYGGNRYLTVPETDTILPAVCFESCLVCNPPQVDITFQVDLSLQLVSTDGVHLAGSFQGWNPAGTPMVNTGNNIYQVTLTLNAGEFHEYKFINGNDWPGAELVPGECAGYGGNREFFVPVVNTTLDLVCFGECDPCVIPTHNFNLKVMLEGPFNGNTMNTELQQLNVLPTSQPYSNAPWNYAGNETIQAGSLTGIVDWVLVEFRSTEGDASTATADKMFYRTAALLMADGSITKTDGISPLEYIGVIYNNLFVVIWHRNHLSIVNATSMASTEGSYMYDFTAEQSYLDGQKPLSPGIFGMISGDSDGNGLIDEYDKDMNWTTEAGNAGYHSADLNLDSQVNNLDKDDLWVPNLGKESKVPQVNTAE